MAVASEVAPSEVVGEDEDDVRAAGRRGVLRAGGGRSPAQDRGQRGGEAESDEDGEALLYQQCLSRFRGEIRTLLLEETCEDVENGSDES